MHSQPRGGLLHFFADAEKLDVALRMPGTLIPLFLRTLLAERDSCANSPVSGLGR